MPLRTASLESARRLVSWQFTETAGVNRLTRISDSSGGFLDTYAEVAQYPCSFSAFPITPVERENTFTVQTVAYWRFLFPYDADVRATDRLTVGTRSFEVVHAGNPSIAITLQAICQEIT